MRPTSGALHLHSWIKTVKAKPQKPIKDAYERAVRESDSYRTA
jgi:hypothetical protein